MDTKTFAGLLAASPPADLTRPDGSLDLDAAASRSPEMELACAQAQDYAAATGRLEKVLRWHLQPRRA